MTPPQPLLTIFLPSLAAGGVERVMLNLAEGFVRRGIRVDIVLAHAEGPYLAQVPPTIGVCDLGARGVLASLPALMRYLQRMRPTAVLAGQNHANLVALWARALTRVPTRVIVSAHGLLTPLQRAPRLRDRLLPRAMQLYYPWADAVVAVSTGVQIELLAHARLAPAQVRVIYNPVVTPALFALAEAMPPHPWFTTPGPPIILGIGRLAPEKDFLTLVRAFARVRQVRPTRLLVLGEGPERGRLEYECARLGLTADVVALPGFTANPYAYLARAALFVQSSRWEALPGVLIEAMALGVPLVATDCPGGTREILDGGRRAPLVPPGDPGALADAMQERLTALPPPSPGSWWHPFTQEVVLTPYQDVCLPGWTPAPPHSPSGGDYAAH
jgi:glycosyltransferase involved in cell wall biosynthesis